ncbi:glycosyltransferase N-terminal domain-containing protein [soil metagenome]
MVYEAALHAARPAVLAAAPFNEKLRRGVHGRASSMRALRSWAESSRDHDRPLLWLHAPSVGEALMAGAILAAAQQRAPHVQSLFTFFSPSAERVAQRVGADWAGYLPWDLRSTVRAALRLARPDVVAFVRTEIWPVLVREAQRQGASTVLVNAVLAAGSSRAGRAARMLLGSAYARLDAVGVVSEDDIPRFGRLGVSPARISVTGDARFDQVCKRVQQLDRDRPLLRSLSAASGLTLVAGSTWPEDEEPLLAALSELRDDGRPWRLVIAPHEPTATHVGGIERRLDAVGMSHARLPAIDALAPADVQAFVVDRTGVLADLYAVAHAAWVGGGFGSAGLHSVIEPAALGVPVLYGPRHGNAREAQLLADAGGGTVARSTAEIRAALAALHDDPLHRRHTGDAARAFVAAHAGGADRNAHLILRHLPPSPHPPHPPISLR